MLDIFLDNITDSVSSTAEYIFQALRLLRMRRLLLERVWLRLQRKGMLLMTRDGMCLMLQPRCRHFPLHIKCYGR
jgi:hypothetical protein